VLARSDAGNVRDAQSTRAATTKDRWLQWDLLFAATSRGDSEAALGAAVAKVVPTEKDCPPDRDCALSVCAAITRYSHAPPISCDDAALIADLFTKPSYLAGLFSGNADITHVTSVISAITMPQGESVFS
jgi:hypothetical protein